MISYGQNFEDVMLNRAFGGKSSGFYIDVGAMDPVEGSVTKHFYDSGWSGINIEPDERFHQKLIAERPRDINLLTAVGDKQEDRLFYRFDAQGISTLSEEFFDYFASRNHTWLRTTVPVTTLAAICDQYVKQPVDFLKIDAEGWEGPILRGANWSRFRPIILVIEATKPYSSDPHWEGWEPELLQNGFGFAFFDGLNRFYVREEDRGLIELFRIPTNVLDNFRPYEAVRLEEINNHLQSHVAGLQTQLDGVEHAASVFKSQTEELNTQLAALQMERDTVWHDKEAQREHCQSQAEELHAQLIASQAERAAVWQEKEGQRERFQSQAEELHAQLTASQAERAAIWLEKEAERLRNEEAAATSHQTTVLLNAEMQTVQTRLAEATAAQEAQAARLNQVLEQVECSIAESNRLRIWLGKVSQEKAALHLVRTRLESEIQQLRIHAESMEELYTEPLTGVPASDIRVEIEHCPPAMLVNSSVQVRIRLVNLSAYHLTSSGPNPVCFSYHWMDADTNALVVNEGCRTPLRLPVRANDFRNYEMVVDAPETPGRYILHTCVVQEQVRWFDQPNGHDQRLVNIQRRS